MEGILFLQAEVEFQPELQPVEFVGKKAPGDEVVEKIAAVLHVRAGVGGEERAVGVEGNIRPRKNAREMGRETGRFLILINGGIADGEFHAFSLRRFIKTFTFSSLAPEPLKVPRTGVASAKSRP